MSKSIHIKDEDWAWLYKIKIDNKLNSIANAFEFVRKSSSLNHLINT